MAIAFLGGCSFNAQVQDPNAIGDADIDAPPMLDAYFPDAPASCPMVTPPTCVTGSNTLRECKSIGAAAVDVLCSWGCIAGEPHHCGKLVPSGGGLGIDDLVTGGVQDKTIIVANDNVVFNTVNGEITGIRPAGVNMGAHRHRFKINANVGSSGAPS